MALQFVAPNEPTPKQWAVFDWIKKFMAERGYPPSIREIADGFGILSPNGVLCHLKALKAKGYMVQDDAGKSRAWIPRVKEGHCKACGQPLGLERPDAPKNGS